MVDVFQHDPSSLEAVLEGMRCGLCVTNQAGQFVYVNTAYCRLYGYPREALIGRHFSLVLPEDARASARAMHDAFMAGAVEVDGQWVVRHRDGRLLNVEVQAGRMTASGGQSYKITTVIDTTRRKQVEQALIQSEARLAEAQRIGNIGNWSVCLSGGAPHWSDQIFAILGQRHGTLTPSAEAYLAAVHPEDRDLVTTAVRAARDSGRPIDLVHRLCRADGSLRIVHVLGERLQDPGRPPCLVGTIQDVTEQNQRDQELKMLSQVVEQNTAIILITDPNGVILYANPRLTAVTGFAPEEVIGQTPRLFKSGQTDPSVYTAMWATLKAGLPWNGELLNSRKDGTFYWEHAWFFPVFDTRGRITHYVAIKEDITHQKRMEAQLLREKYHDHLTGLPNRLLAFDRLGEQIKRAARDHHKLGVLLVNLDGFSRINEDYGHDWGDRVLMEAARRLRSVVSGEDSLLARIGSDRFCLTVEGFSSSATLELTARQILEALAQPMGVKDGSVRLSGTIGIALFPTDGGNADLLLRNAEVATRAARARGANSYRFFVGSKERSRSLQLETSLYEALARGELFLEYQPIVAATDLRPRGAEALIRWIHPDMGRVSPAEFVPLFEDTDLVHEIGAWVLETAATRLAQLRRETGLDLFLSVNVSPRQLRRAEFVERVDAVLRQTGLPATALDLEITERLFVEKRPEVLGVLEALHDTGVAVTLDDFGIGYSALGALMELPVRVLKVDRSFIDRIDRRGREYTLTATILGLCQEFGIRTVAEGVETPQQRDLLQAMQADYLQGYLFSRPLAWEAFCDLVRRASDLPPAPPRP